MKGNKKKNIESTGIATYGFSPFKSAEFKEETEKNKSKHC
jgi:hypothetical protein